MLELREIKRFVLLEMELYKNLDALEEILDSHIRFEGRMLFNEIQSVTTNEQLQQMQFCYADIKFADNLANVLWE